MNLRLGNRSATGGSAQGCDCGGPRNVCDNRRITAIVRDKNDVMVMFDDCTFMKASFDVVADSVKHTVTAGGTDLTSVLSRLDALEAKPDNDTIFDASALEARLTSLETFKQCVCDGMERVDSLSGKKTFIAFKHDFSCCGNPPTTSRATTSSSAAADQASSDNNAGEAGTSDLGAEIPGFAEYDD